ncbi:MAG: ABC transporter substrate-binding protein [Clostridiales bacterium]|nr:ABC transporter substrate-binding protein [Clostridiales bacterium]
MKRNIFGIVLAIFAFIILGTCLTGLLYEKTETDESQMYEEIYMVLPTYGYVSEDMELVTDAMNEISIRECGVKVNYIFADVTDMETVCELRLEAREEIDLMPCMQVKTLLHYVSQGTIAPLDELLEDEGKDILAVYPDKEWEPLRLNGEIYAVSPMQEITNYEGFLVREDILAALQITLEEIVGDYNYEKNVSIEAIDEMLTPVLEMVAASSEILEDGTYVRDKKIVSGAADYGGVFSQCQLIDYEGFGNTFGVTVNQSDQIVNLYETEEYISMAKLVQKWQQAGYIYNLDEKITENSVKVYQNGDALGVFSDTTPGKAESLTYSSGYSTASITLTKTCLTSELQLMGNWVIPENSSKKTAAMKILNLMYSDADYVNLYLYGIEGIHYTLNKDESVHKISEDYNQSMKWMFGNGYLALKEEGIVETQTEDSEKEYSRYYGFVYNGQDLEEEISSLQKILDNYLPDIENGIVEDVDASLEEMNQKLYAAGLQEVMADKQKQLDLWLGSD